LTTLIRILLRTTKTIDRILSVSNEQRAIRRIESQIFVVHLLKVSLFLILCSVRVIFIVILVVLPVNLRDAFGLADSPFASESPLGKQLLLLPISATRLAQSCFIIFFLISQISS
jgi:hypothetical protein